MQRIVIVGEVLWLIDFYVNFWPPISSALRTKAAHILLQTFRNY